MDEKENKLEFKNIFFQKTLTCENCEKAIVPRSDVAFKDMKYGIILCLECRDKYLQGKINLV